MSSANRFTVFRHFIFSQNCVKLTGAVIQGIMNHVVEKNDTTAVVCLIS